VTPQAQFSSPIARGQRAIENDGAPASRRRRHPVERRHGFKISDYQPTSDEDGQMPHNSPLWARPDAAGYPASGVD